VLASEKLQTQETLLVIFFTKGIRLVLRRSTIKNLTIMGVVIVASALLMAIAMPSAWAIHPSEHCDLRDKLVGLFTGKPHYERQAMVMIDELPGEGHHLELFMNSGEGRRHSYTLIRIRRGGNIACIISAGLVGSRSQDQRGRSHLNLNDENDPEVIEIVTCHKHYVMTRTIVEEDVCTLMVGLSSATRFIVSYGRILEDYRASIPWPSN
jgi:hypothetical protein